MAERSSPASHVDVITEAMVAGLGRLAGLTFTPERLPVIAERLREMHTLAAVLDGIDDACPPANRFDPGWPEADER